MKFMDKDDFEKQNVFGTGQANTAYAKYFIGDSFLNPLTDPKCGLFLANVTFEPGCRNNWHIHHATKGGGKPDAVQGRVAAEKKALKNFFADKEFLIAE